MLIRHTTHSGHVEWLRMRAALWPDCPLEDYYSEMRDQLVDPARYAVFVIERDTGQLGGFLEASLVTEFVKIIQRRSKYSTANRWY